MLYVSEHIICTHYDSLHSIYSEYINIAYQYEAKILYFLVD